MHPVERRVEIEPRRQCQFDGLFQPKIRTVHSGFSNQLHFVLIKDDIVIGIEAQQNLEIVQTAFVARDGCGPAQVGLQGRLFKSPYLQQCAQSFRLKGLLSFQRQIVSIQTVEIIACHFTVEEY